jgi:hypothetical protein
MSDTIMGETSEECVKSMHTVGRMVGEMLADAGSVTNAFRRMCALCCVSFLLSAAFAFITVSLPFVALYNGIFGKRSKHDE